MNKLIENQELLENNINEMKKILEEIKTWNRDELEKYLSNIILQNITIKEHMLKEIKENSLEESVKLLGFKENPYPYLKKADIFVSSSRFEGFSLVVGEALCLKKPIIATKCVGPLELLNNGEYGLLAEIEDVRDLAEKIKKLVLDKGLRKKYSSLSKKRSEIFNIDKTIQEVEKVFKMS